jgi:hypothetical protein
MPKYLLTGTYIQYNTWMSGALIFELNALERKLTGKANDKAHHIGIKHPHKHGIGDISL